MTWLSPIIRQRITVIDQQAFIAAISRLTIEIEQPDAIEVIRDGPATARQYGLTAYEAAYVEPAVRERLQLATPDRRMRDAAVIAGVSVIEP